MKLLGGKYVRYINKFYNRTGTLWEGRFKCSLIDEKSYFLACLHYIETNPVRAGLVGAPELYRWSSYRFRAFGDKSKVLDLGPFYKDLGTDPEERKRSYQSFFRNTLPESTCEIIREMTNRGGFVGDADFKSQLEEALCRKIIIRKPGRPSKPEK
jgi:putative transposase